MRITVQNNANIINKYIRFAKWKLYKLISYNRSVLYSNLYISKEGNAVKNYKATLLLGLPGNDIIVKANSTSIRRTWAKLSKKMGNVLTKESQKYLQK